MVSLRELLTSIDQIQEAAPMPTARSSQPEDKVSDDIGYKFISDLAHAKEDVQVEILSILFGLNWEDPHTPEEISAAYVSADTNTHNEIDNIMANQLSDIETALQPHNAKD